MRSYALVAVFAASGLIAQTPRPVSVEQLQQVLAWEEAAHEADSAAAAQLEALRLTEQLTAFTLNRINRRFHPGKDVEAALEVLSDMSAFLPAPASESLQKGIPGAHDQQAILDAARKYVAVSTNHLPDFLATRTTRRFKDVPVIMPHRTYQSGLYLAGTVVRQTTYRNGQEINPAFDVRHDGSGSDQGTEDGLSSTGEFGQVLAIVMADLARGKTAWSYWQQSQAGLVAVFRYEVPEQASHYRVDFCCELNSPMHNVRFNGTPAYHGSLSIDPTNGSVLRLTLVADFQGFDPSPTYEVAVQYANVDVGGSNAILPVRCAIIGEEVARAKKREWISLFVNDVAFTDYHRFGTSVRVLPGVAKAGQSHQ